MRHTLFPCFVPPCVNFMCDLSNISVDCVFGYFLFFFFFYFILFYNHTWHSLTIQLHGTYLQQDYKIYLRYSFTTYLFPTYLH